MSNPANQLAIGVTDETRVPMGTPQQQLAVPEIEGYVCHWFADRPGRIPRAARGGFEFVSPDEIKLNSFTLAGNVEESGNTDLGNRVSILGGTDEGGRGMRLYLMKIKREWWERDAALREETSERIADTLRRGRTGAERETGGDAAMRYSRKSNDNLFTRKTQRRS